MTDQTSQIGPVAARQGERAGGRAGPHGAPRSVHEPVPAWHDRGKDDRGAFLESPTGGNVDALVAHASTVPIGDPG